MSEERLEYLVIGAGQCGNRILDEMVGRSLGSGRFSRTLARKDLPCEIRPLGINTSYNDLKECANLRDVERLHVKGIPGAGANRLTGGDAFTDNRDEIQEAIGERAPWDAAFVLTSAGGGTGSSFAPPLVELLKNMNPTSPVYPLAVLPFRDESDIYIQNTGFALRDLANTRANSVILASNDYLSREDTSVYESYQKINVTLADRLAFLLTGMAMEMMMVVDLGDLMTVTGRGCGFSTMGYAEAVPHQPVHETIADSLKMENLLFETDPFAEAERALMLVRGEESYLDTDAILSAVTDFSESVGDVFKGVSLDEGLPRVLSLFSLRDSTTLKDVIGRSRSVLESRQERDPDDQSEVQESFGQVEDYTL